VKKGLFASSSKTEHQNGTHTIDSIPYLKPKTDNLKPIAPDTFYVHSESRSVKSAGIDTGLPSACLTIMVL
jgi:hypothetical protein